MLKSRVLREEFAHYRRLPAGHPDKSYDGLLMAIRRTIEENRRDGIRQARFGLPPSPAAPFVSKPSGDRSGSPKRTGRCYQWKREGKCKHGDECAYRHDDDPSSKPHKSSSTKQQKHSSSDDSSSLSDDEPNQTQSDRDDKPKSRPIPPGEECRFNEKGICRYGDKCQSVHTQSDNERNLQHDQSKRGRANSPARPGARPLSTGSAGSGSQSSRRNSGKRSDDKRRSQPLQRGRAGKSSPSRNAAVAVEQYWEQIMPAAVATLVEPCQPKSAAVNNVTYNGVVLKSNVKPSSLPADQVQRPSASGTGARANPFIQLPKMMLHLSTDHPVALT